MSLTTLRAIIKYVSRPKSAAKDIDIADILGQKYRYRQRRYQPISIQQSG